VDESQAVTIQPHKGFAQLSLTAVWSWSLRHPFLSIALLALIPRLVLVATSKLFDGFVLDDGTYHQMASNMAAGDISLWDDFTYSLFWRTATFLVPVTGIYKVFGPNMAMAQIFVALLGTATAVIVTRIAMEFLETRLALAAGAIIALLPSQAFWSSQLMKDASVWATLSSLALMIALANRSTGKQLIYCGLGVALSLCALAFLREHTLVVASWATMAGALAGLPRQRLARIAGAVVLGITIPWFVASIGPAGLDLVRNAGSLEEIRFKMAQGANTAVIDTTPGGTEAELNENTIRRQQLLAEISKLQGSEGEVAGSGQPDPTAADRLRELQKEMAALIAEQERLLSPPPGGSLSEDSGSLDPNIRHLPRGISVMLIEPFPLPFTGSASLRLARLESLIWYPLLILAGYGLWRARSYLRVFLFPLLCGGGILVMYALTEGNVGTAHRHRGEVVWVVVLLASLGLSKFVERRKRPA
jgi:4-amino-4-deoxy-L-arabinose transferase-like glycosyltransferase